MTNRRIEIFIICLLSEIIFTSGNVPIPLRYQKPENCEESIKNENESCKTRKEKRKVICKQVKCTYLAHQKNRLIYFSDQDNFIWFDDQDNKYSYFLSNFYPASLSLWNMKFYCSEAAFQAAKFLEKPEIAVRFTHLEGKDARSLAQTLSDQQRGDWYQVRESIMFEVLTAKFQQHPELSELLLATGKAYLVEKSDRDPFWADGGDGKGKNRLGELLMKVRGENGGTGIVPKPSKYLQLYGN